MSCAQSISVVYVYIYVYAITRCALIRAAPPTFFCNVLTPSSQLLIVLRKRVSSKEMLGALRAVRAGLGARTLASASRSTEETDHLVVEFLQNEHQGDVALFLV